MSALRNIFRSDDFGQANEILKGGALDPVISLLGHNNREIISNVLDILSIMTNGNKELVSFIVNNTIYMEKIMCLMNSDFINDCLILNNYFLNLFILFIFRSKDGLVA